MNDLRSLCRRYNELLVAQEYQAISDDMDATNMSEDIVLLVGKLRYSVCRWNRIPSWIPFRNNVHDEIERRGLVADELLRGLYDLTTHREGYQIVFERMVGLTDSNEQEK